MILPRLEKLCRVGSDNRFWKMARVFPTVERAKVNGRNWRACHPGLIRLWLFIKARIYPRHTHKSIAIAQPRAFKTAGLFVMLGNRHCSSAGVIKYPRSHRYADFSIYFPRADRPELSQRNKCAPTRVCVMKSFLLIGRKVIAVDCSQTLMLRWCVVFANLFHLNNQADRHPRIVQINPHFFNV